MLVGEIIKAHGIRGEVLVRPHTDHPERFAPGKILWLDETQVTQVTVTSSRHHANGLIVKLAEVEDRTNADLLRGRGLFIDRTQSVAAREGEYWVHELLGYEVIDTSGEVLGRIEDIHLREAQDLWEVKTGSGSVLVPAVPKFVKEIDKSLRKVVVDPPEGLFE